MCERDKLNKKKQHRYKSQTCWISPVSRRNRNLFKTWNNNLTIPYHLPCTYVRKKEILGDISLYEVRVLSRCVTCVRFVTNTTCLFDWEIYESSKQMFGSSICVCKVTDRYFPSGFWNSAISALRIIKLPIITFRESFILIFIKCCC